MYIYIYIHIYGIGHNISTSDIIINTWRHRYAQNIKCTEQATTADIIIEGDGQVNQLR